ncbi:MAG: UvrD-helicase domain-containing protein [Clostridium sp.]|uniref:UvrD-helicase domain-containing protein n=1 Tax=Clostridium sp. TaxID=1506 RepID=UPI003EE70207
MMKSKLIISGAGVGKTTYLVKKALELESKKIAIITYTEANELEIRKKFFELNGLIPANIRIETWFSFFIKHGIKPYKGELFEELFEKDINGMIFSEGISNYIKTANKIVSKKSIELSYYFNKEFKIYSDKISNFICECNRKSKGKVINRLAEIFDYIFLDEVQDLAGYDLEILQLLVKSKIKILMVGDPRQTTYSTHKEKKNKKYNNGKVKEYFNDKLKKEEVEIDEKSLVLTHRNNFKICELANKLYPNFKPTEPCYCCHNELPENCGIHYISSVEVQDYLKKYNPVQIKWNNRVKIDEKYCSINFGNSKGLSFDRVLIYPTKDMKEWFSNNNTNLKEETRAKLYVGITRARYSVGIIM